MPRLQIGLPPQRIEIHIELEAPQASPSKTHEVMTKVATKAAVDMHTLLEGWEPKVISMTHTEWTPGDDEDDD
jgi:hypothetical protein